MKNCFFIACILMILLSFACSKESGNGSSTITSPPVPSLYDTLGILTLQGASWNYLRIDDYGGTAANDTSNEIITINGKTNWGAIKNFYINSAVPLYPVYYNIYVQYMNESLKLSDTASFSILSINNLSKNSISTEYVYLSRKLFIILPKVTPVLSLDSGIIDYGLPIPNISSISFTSPNSTQTSWNPGVYEKGDTSFIYANKTFPVDLFTTETNFSALYDGGFGGSTSYFTALYISKQNGLLQYKMGHYTSTRTGAFSMSYSQHIITRIKLN